jgi:two-component system sensor histidine kinase ChvG
MAAVISESHPGATAAAAGGVGAARSEKKAKPVRPSTLARLSRSLVFKLLLLLTAFVAVPGAVYFELEQADADKRSLLLESVREQGRLIGETLRQVLEQPAPQPLIELPDAVQQLSTDSTGIKVLLLPKGKTSVQDFYFVAVEPPLEQADLETERQSLIQRGVLQNLQQSCEGNRPIALRYKTVEGQDELLTSITPVVTEMGCWVIVTAHTSGGFLGTSIGQPYWQTWEVQVAAFIYLVLVLLTLAIFFGIWRNLMGFRRLARGITSGRGPAKGFAAENRVPELSFVAEEFDRMTKHLSESADDIRRAAEDNAHAFKTPIAIARQSLEPLRRAMPDDHPRGRRALDVIEESIDRLDHLVNSARRLDETVAELLHPPRDLIDLSAMVSRMTEAYREALQNDGMSLRVQVQRGVKVYAGEDLLETVLENIIDNAISVSPEDGEIKIDLKVYGRQAVLTVKDQGPGVKVQDLERIFQRYVSIRPRDPEDEADDAESAFNKAHSGIGLWITRRNLEAIGGGVHAENAPGGGLMLVVRLPMVAA